MVYGLRPDFRVGDFATLATGTWPHFETLVVPGATFVFVSQPHSGGTITVRTAAGAEYSAELTQPFVQNAVYMTVVRIEEPGPVTVAIDDVAVRG